MGELMRGKSADIRSPAKKQWGGGKERGAAKKGGHSANQTYSYPPWASYTIFTPQGKYYQSNQIK